jgi:hypothetical protein
MYEDVTEWFAPNVGMIKFSYAKAPWEAQATNTHRFELVSFAIK